jgi:hypothetical protein
MTRWFSRVRKFALWGGAIFVALDVAALVVLYVSGNYGSERLAYSIARVCFLVHPIAERLYIILVLVFFDTEKMGLHDWKLTAIESMWNTILYFGLGFVEAFSYGLLLGALAGVLLPWRIARKAPSH